MTKCLLVLILIPLLCCGCTVEAPAVTTATPTEQSLPLPTAPAFSYEDLKYTDFLFSSGAGAWGTTLYIEADGTFSGIYHDTEMGDTGAGYPNGTVYYCDFYGQFGPAEALENGAYSLPIQVIRYGHVPDSQEIIEGQRYCYTTALGIEGTLCLILYPPDTAADTLPLEYRQWVGLADGDTALLPFWGLYNEPQQCGFSSSNRILQAKEAVLTAEEVERSINAILNEASTQTDMNITANQRYVIWDDALNQLWEVLRQVLDEEAFSRLTEKQREWIDEKERSARESAQAFVGGSLYPTVYYTALADMTKERTYLLLEYLPE